MSYSFRIGALDHMHMNLAAVDTWSTSGLCFASVFTYSQVAKDINKILKRKTDVAVAYSVYSLRPEDYETIVTKVPDSDFSHVIIYRKSKLHDDEENDIHRMESCVFLEVNSDRISRYPFFRESISGKDCKDKDIIDSITFPEDLIDTVYGKLYKNTPTPILRDWVPYIIRKAAKNYHFFPMKFYRDNDNVDKKNKESNSNTNSKVMIGYVFNVKIKDLTSWISNGLKDGSIVIDKNASREASEPMKAIEGLDGYLNTYSEVLANRIQNSFTPRFTPGVDEYSQTLKDFIDYAHYSRKIDLYPAQKDVIQSVANCWDHQRSAFVIGECGSGKTAIGIGSIVTHNQDKKKMLNLIMCPGHLVSKWKYEIKSLSPLSDVYIIDSFSTLLNLMPTLKKKKRYHNIWLVMSKETAKLGYEERPAAIWKRTKKGFCFVCPECGKPLYTLKWEGRGRSRRAYPIFFNERSFQTKNANNQTCMNKVKRWNEAKGIYEDKICNAKLWEPSVKIADDCNNAAESWVKLGKEGWIMRKHMDSLRSQLEGYHPKKEDRELLKALEQAYTEGEPPQRYLRKYPLSKYIRRYLKNKIDYTVFDEIHELKAGDSAQGEAFGDLACASKRVLGLTGTLLNGYAAGIFYILYRTFAGMMKKDGFDYNDESNFTKKYGVVKKTSRFKMQGSIQTKRAGATKTKALPGVSPLVFTQFLLDNAAFISQEDISDGLPGYKEIPVAIKMDDELRGAYKVLEDNIRSNMSAGEGNDNMKIMGQMVQMLSIYPDQPYGQPPLIHPDTGAVLVTPEELSHNTRNKETKFLEIVKDKITAGEKVLVYYHWTNRTDLATRLPKLLKDNGIKSAVLKSSIKASERESWIQDQVQNKHIQVLFCNPKLVETGLDLLDFTTIVFYQMGYNLYTMRQASRRSWRLSQDKDVEVYFLYYQETIQENALSLMATKLQASMAIEGKFSEEGLNALSNNEDIFTQIASSVTEGIRDAVDVQVFQKLSKKSKDKTNKDDISSEENTIRTLLNYSIFNTKLKSKRIKTVPVDNNIKTILNSPAQLANVDIALSH